MMPMIESIPVLTIESVQVAEFIVEDVEIQSLNGGIKKKFTSQASSYSVVFKWKFGDETDPSLYTSTHDRTIIHEYKKAGTYNVYHQACLLDLPCCYNNDIPWCLNTITVQAPPAALGIGPLLGMGFLFGLLFKKECEDYKNKKDCEKHDSCEWKQVQEKWKQVQEKWKCVKKEKRAPLIPPLIPPAKVPIPPTKEEKIRLIPPKPKVKPFTKEEKYLINKLREKGAVGEPTCLGPECRIGKWLAVARPKGQPPIIIHDP